VPWSDTTSRSLVARPSTTSKRASRSWFLSNGEDATTTTRLLIIGKTYGVPMTQVVGETIADSTTDMSLSSMSNVSH